jgi:hypothetical protein
VQFQDWAIGQKVKVGFMQGLEVITKEVVSGYPVYTLRSAKGVLYAFEPYKGISKL